MFPKFISSISPALLPCAFVALTAIAASANADPTVATGSATGILSNAAVLNATVNPNGTATGVVFQFGTTTNYGASTVVQSIGNGISDVAVHVTVQGLKPSTTYHFRAVAMVSSNTAGSTTPPPTFNGADQTFVT